MFRGFVLYTDNLTYSLPHCDAFVVTTGGPLWARHHLTSSELALSIQKFVFAVLVLSPTRTKKMSNLISDISIRATTAPTAAAARSGAAVLPCVGGALELDGMSDVVDSPLGGACLLHHGPFNSRAYVMSWSVGTLAQTLLLQHPSTSVRHPPPKGSGARDTAPSSFSAPDVEGLGRAEAASTCSSSERYADSSLQTTTPTAATVECCPTVEDCVQHVCTLALARGYRKIIIKADRKSVV